MIMQELLALLGIVGVAFVLSWALRRIGVSGWASGHCAPAARSDDKAKEPFPPERKETEEEVNASW